MNFKLKKSLLPVLLTLVVVALLLPHQLFAFAGGQGTLSDPYQIATHEHLNDVRNHLDKHFIQVADIDLSDYSNNEGWEPIGIVRGEKDYDAFEGVFDGDGYKITNLSIFRHGDITAGDLSGAGIGLFSVNKGEIKNVGLEDVNVDGSIVVGGLVGQSEGSDAKIINSYVKGTVKGQVDDIGGLVGRNQKGAQILKSYAMADVKGSEYIGGLVGRNTEGAQILKSYAMANVEGPKYIGGLVGSNRDTDAYGIAPKIIDSFATGTVHGTNAVGGLLGRLRDGGVIRRTYATARVSGDDLIGGLVGDVGGEYFSEDSFWDTEISGQEYSAGGEAKSTAEMKDISTFEDYGLGWSIADTSVQKNDGYPFLSGGESPTWLITRVPDTISLTADTEGEGKILVNGDTYTEPLVFEAGETISFEAAPAQGWKFDLWQTSEGGTRDDILVEFPFDTDVTVTAKFTELHTVTVDTVTGEGSVGIDGQSMGEADTYLVEGDDTISLVAVPADLWLFDTWVSPVKLKGFDTTAELFVNSDTDIEVKFRESDTAVITVELVGDGKIEIKGRDVSDTVSDTGDSVVVVSGDETGDSIEIIARPEYLWKFDTWTVPTGLKKFDTASELFVNSDTTVGVKFVERDTVSVDISLTGQGSISLIEEEISINSDTTIPVPSEDTFTLVATADTGWHFAGWDTAVNHTDTTAELYLSGDTELLATFVKKHTLTMDIDGDGHIEIGSDTYSTGDTHLVYGDSDITVKAVPAEVSYFDTWLEPGSLLQASDTTANLSVDGDTTIGARFKKYGFSADPVRPFGGELVGTEDTLFIKISFYGRAGDSLSIAGVRDFEISSEGPGEWDTAVSLSDENFSAGDTDVVFEYRSGSVIDTKVVSIKLRDKIESFEADTATFGDGRFNVHFSDTRNITADTSPLEGPLKDKIVEAAEKFENRWVDGQDVTIIEITTDKDDGGTLTISYSDIADKLEGYEDDLRIYRLNEETKEFSDTGINHKSVDTDAKNVTAYVEDFSVFAVLTQSTISTVSDELGEVYSWPNPFRSDQHNEIHFSIPDNYGNDGSLDVYNIQGQQVYSTSWSNPGGTYNTIKWRPDVASGTYIYVIKGGGNTSSDKMTIIR